MMTRMIATMMTKMMARMMAMMITFTGVLAVVLAAAPVSTNNTLDLLAVLVLHHRALSHGGCGGGGTLVGRGVSVHYSKVQ